MSAVKLQAKCPTCGGVREVRSLRGAYVMAKHYRRSGLAHLRCDGGAVTVADVIGYARSERNSIASRADYCETERAGARDALVRKLASIDENERELRADVAAYDRAIARLSAKAT